MASKISIDELAGEIVMAVTQYTEDVVTGVEKAVDETAGDIVRDTKEMSPKSGKPGKTYAKGWTSKKETHAGVYRRIVHNKNKPTLVHLLEFGYTKRDGKRAPGRPHLRPAYDRHLAAFEKKIKKIIENGGNKE